MVEFSLWPATVRQEVTRIVGEPTSIETLHGRSGAAVYRVRYAHQSVIVKQTDSQSEAAFYEQIAPVLRTQDMPVPDLMAIIRQDPTSWLVLEDIPLSIEGGNTPMLAVLARLHSLPLSILPPAFKGYKPQWASDLTSKALACFEDTAAAQNRPILDDFQPRAQHLFESEAIISGDPNPGNWGLHQNGTPVLYDWERITLATPAIDLAITVAGLGTPPQFTDTARHYLIERERIKQPYSASAAQLAKDIAIAKVWVVIEYLSLYTDGALQPDATLDYVKSAMTSWLETLAVF